jgi:hypothetical protein
MAYHFSWSVWLRPGWGVCALGCSSGSFSQTTAMLTTTRWWAIITCGRVGPLEKAGNLRSV